MKNIATARAIAAVVVLLATTVARSAPPAQIDPKIQPSAESAAVVQPAPQRESPFGQAGVVSDSALQRIVGREDLSQVVIAQNTGTVANNTVGDQSTTGTITFDGQAFQGLHGLSVLSANTGNNVSINASLNVNVALRQ